MSQKSDPNEVPGALGPLFGRTDPETSRWSATYMRKYIGPAQAKALRLVRERPGSTCPELACGDEQERQRIGRRLNELEKAGLIYRDGVRDGCGIWFPSVK